jgi:diguanylate cyclase (GGDEF)-like protein/PAS domain S-box-containing protein
LIKIDHTHPQKETADMDFDVNFFITLPDRLYEGVYFMDLDRKILYWNKAAEKITGFTAHEVVGSHCRNNILVHVDQDGTLLCDAKSCPAAQSLENGTESENHVYLHHKDGHRIPVRTKIIPVRNSSGQIIGAAELFSDKRDVLESQRRIAELEKLSMIDAVSQAGNRRFAELNLARLFSEFQQFGHAFSVFFVDIDHFKRVNDVFGHEVGDRTIRMVAKTLANCVRTSDVTARWGGEEFIILVQDVHDKELRIIAERTRVLVARSHLSTENGLVEVTVSIGCATVKSDDTPESLVSRADALMYAAKKLGRNRVVME